MHAFDDPVWIGACVAAGVSGIGLAVRHAMHAFGGPPDSPVERPRTRRLVRALRALLTGACLIGLAYGLHVGSTGWVVTCVAIGLEELYETTMALSVLGWCERLAAEDGEPARARASGGACTHGVGGVQ